MVYCWSGSQPSVQQYILRSKGLPVHQWSQNTQETTKLSVYPVGGSVCQWFSAGYHINLIDPGLSPYQPRAIMKLGFLVRMKLKYIVCKSGLRLLPVH